MVRAAQRAEAVDTYCYLLSKSLAGRWIILAIAGIGILVSDLASAQDMSGSMRINYQNAGGPVDDGTLAQQYYIRLTDRLFVKNLLMLTGNIYHRTGTETQAVDYRPRYDLQLSSTGYSALAGYEPYTIRRGGAGDEEYRRWRGNVLLTPAKLPRLGYDMTRTRRDKGDGRVGRDDWNSYNMSWQGGSRLVAASYSRQKRSAGDTLSETLDVYRAMTSTDFALPEQGRLTLSYNFDRTSNERSGLLSTELDQHVPSASMSVSPSRWLNWTAQYSGRYITQRDLGRAARSSNDQLASGMLNLLPSPRWSFGLIRYYERAEERATQQNRSTDYWQVRASTDRVFFRQINSQFTVYRIAYNGAREGARYTDAYFMSLRGRPHRHAELSTEASLSDRHGLQALRYAVSSTSFLRLHPSRRSQTQLSYNAVAVARQLSNFDISEESFSGNLQYTPDPKMSIAGGATVRRNRLLDSVWRSVWNASMTYRWPGIANLSAYYTNRELVTVTPVNGSTQIVESPAQESLILAVDWWLGPRTSLSANYSWRGGETAADIWGLGVTTQF